MSSSTRRSTTAIGLAAGLGLTGVVLAVSVPAVQAAPAEHVTICHARGTPDTAGNGYVVISPSMTGVLRGHANWDFKDHEVGDNGHAADIIPPFEYTDGAGDSRAFPGQNWDADGQEIWDRRCSAGSGSWEPI